MGNNLLAANEPKQNRNTKLIERKIETRKTKSQQQSLGTSDLPKDSQVKHIWASTAYKMHVSVIEVYLIVSDESSSCCNFQNR